MYWNFWFDRKHIIKSTNKPILLATFQLICLYQKSIYAPKTTVVLSRKQAIYEPIESLAVLSLDSSFMYQKVT